MKKPSCSILISLLFFISCSPENREEMTELQGRYYSPGTHNRTVAEWEPALGTLIVWPLSIPHKLVIELARDNHLFTMVESEDSRKEAEKWFREWQIDPDKVTFIYAKQGEDAWWVRDWGPSAVFSPEGGYKLADGKYIYSTPLTDRECNDSLRFLYFDENNNMVLTETEDAATSPLSKQLDFQILDLPFINTGGNVMTDGMGTAFSTCVILTENQYHGIEPEKFLHLNDSLLGFQRYNIISNFDLYGIQHIDCFLKLIDEETILVAEPPSDHELFEIYNEILENELSRLVTPYGHPYKILRIKTARFKEDRLAAYTNSLILNKTVYVPLYDIPEDTLALETWERALPGYIVKGFTYHLNDEPIVASRLSNFYKDYGWSDEDALHCRTRAIWNPNMLFISVNHLETRAKTNQKREVYVTIIDYSQEGLIMEECMLFWRIAGETSWNTIPLSATDKDNQFFAVIPHQKVEIQIEYYISAVSNSGEKATRPIAAPVASYKTF